MLARTHRLPDVRYKKPGMLEMTKISHFPNAIVAPALFTPCHILVDFCTIGFNCALDIPHLPTIDSCEVHVHNPNKKDRNVPTDDG